MDATTHPHGTPETHHHGEHHDEHHELGFWRKYVFSTDHKVIGIQYGVTGLIFLFFGFSLMMVMRWQLAYPGHVLPGTFPHWIGWILSKIFRYDLYTVG